MAGGTGFVAAGGNTGRFHVERTALLAEIDAELARCGIVLVCGPWGYGRTTLVGDYARIAHARMPFRPVVRIDFATYEAQAFMNGHYGPLARSLARRARRSSRGTPRAAAGRGSRMGGAALQEAPNDRDDDVGPEGADPLRRIPARYENNATHLVYECVAAQAGAWCAHFEAGAAAEGVPFRDLPLIVIDNLPRMDEGTLGEFAEALAAWSQAGARLIVVSSPSAFIPRSLLPDAFVVTSGMLGVGPAELALWSKDLHVADYAGVAEATMGVPMLVDACRSVQEGNPLHDQGFLRASGRVLEHCLSELMCLSAERGRWAMAMLGKGTLADLAAVGATMREDELAILAETYPLFGIDTLKGTFSCIPMPCERDVPAAVRAVGGDEELSMRCAELLVRHGRLKRAGELAALMSSPARLRLFGRHPDAFADAANSGSIERSMKSVLMGDVADGTLRPGLARLARLHALAHDMPQRLLPEYVVRLTAGTSSGALHAVRAVLGFWKSYAGNSALWDTRDGAAEILRRAGYVERESLVGKAFVQADDAADGVSGKPFDGGAAPGGRAPSACVAFGPADAAPVRDAAGADRQAGAAFARCGEEVYRALGYGDMPAGEGDPGARGGAGAQESVDGVVRAMGVAALAGDGVRYLERLDTLRRLVPFAGADLATSVYAFHAAVCGFLCDRSEEVLAFVGSLAATVVDEGAAPGEMVSVSHALLATAHALACLLVERPSAPRTAAASLATVRSARRFFEERCIEPAAVVLQFVEAVVLIATGGEKQAGGMLARCRARWSVQGALLGQLATSLTLCVASLAQDAVNQAAVHAQAAEALAQRMGVRRAVWLARLFGTVAAVRNGNAPDLDRRLLEATLRQSALHPASSLAVDLELAFLYAARGDAPAARDIVQGVGVFDRPGACRLLVTAVRALGRSRSCVLDLLPRRLRVEYESLRPSSALRRYTGAAEPLNGDPGLLALPKPGRGLSLSLFGGLKVSINGRAVSAGTWGRRKARAVLVVLALYPETPLSREAMIEMLWEGVASTALVRNNLNTILSSLRASLGQKNGGPEYLVSSNGTIGLNLELVDVDVLRFERLARTVLARRRAGNPVELIDACSTLEQLFQTGFAGEEFQGLPRRVQARISELEQLFLDCMVFGSGTALDEGDCQLAVWFARAAERVDANRGDVREALACALGAAQTQERAVEDDGAHAAEEVLADVGGRWADGEPETDGGEGVAGDARQSSEAEPLAEDGKGRGCKRARKRPEIREKVSASREGVACP